MSVLSFAEVSQDGNEKRRLVFVETAVFPVFNLHDVGFAGVPLEYTVARDHLLISLIRKLRPLKLNKKVWTLWAGLQLVP